MFTIFLLPDHDRYTSCLTSSNNVVSHCMTYRGPAASLGDPGGRAADPPAVREVTSTGAAVGRAPPPAGTLDAGSDGDTVMTAATASASTTPAVPASASAAPAGKGRPRRRAASAASKPAATTPSSMPAAPSTPRPPSSLRRREPSWFDDEDAKLCGGSDDGRMLMIQDGLSTERYVSLRKLLLKELVAGVATAEQAAPAREAVRKMLCVDDIGPPLHRLVRHCCIGWATVPSVSSHSNCLLLGRCTWL